MAGTFYLRDGLFFREISQAYIFLDSREDRYFMLSQSQSKIFSKIHYTNGNFSTSEEDDRLINHLMNNGILNTNSTFGNEIKEITYNSPEYSAYDVGSHTLSTIALTRIPKFIHAFLSSSRLRRRNHNNVGLIMKMAEGWKSALPPQKSILRARTIQLTASFHALTPFFFTSYNECFFRSLCLIRYLSLHGLSADWVFGVRLCPFAAHCWVEYDGVILNEDYDITLEFKPIMVV